MIMLRKFIEMGKYIAQYKQMNFPGQMVLNQLEDIVEVIKETEATSLLDFGCGRAIPYRGWGTLTAQTTLGIMPALYDPAVKEYEKMPDGKFDGVYSIDVMEHIPKEELSETLKLIFSKANKFVFLGICTHPAVTILPNGENAHCTLERIDWWINVVDRYRPSNILTHIKTYGEPHLGALCNSYEVLG